MQPRALTLEEYEMMQDAITATVSADEAYRTLWKQYWGRRCKQCEPTDETWKMAKELQCARITALNAEAHFYSVLRMLPGHPEVQKDPRFVSKKRKDQEIVEALLHKRV